MSKRVTMLLEHKALVFQGPKPLSDLQRDLLVVRALRRVGLPARTAGRSGKLWVGGRKITVR